MKINAYAKINIGLDVLKRRVDGYHEVRMIMQSIALHDELEIDRTDERGIFIHTDREDLPVNEDNLIYKAAGLMMDEYDLPGGMRIELTKIIPIAAGLAGGSSDAASAIIAINKLYQLGLKQEELASIGVRIGADVPFCIMGGTVLSEGIGEILTPISPFPGCGILIAKPPVSISTAYVYSHLCLDKITHPDIDGMISGIDRGDIKEISSRMGNVLESVTIEDNPVIEDIKRIMIENGSVGALMSGSGPSVFGLFDSEEMIKKTYEILSGSGLVSELFITEPLDPQN